MKSNLFFLCILWLVSPVYAGVLNFPDGFKQVDQTYGDYDGVTIGYYDGIDMPNPAYQPAKSPKKSRLQPHLGV